MDIVCNSIAQLSGRGKFAENSSGKGRGRSKRSVQSSICTGSTISR